jgi:hypothetical protein
VGIGVASVISPLYIAEISVPGIRGRLVSMYQLAITIGFLGAYLANYGLLQYSGTLEANGATGGLYGKVFATEVWRGMLGMEAVPALLFLIALFFIPESPRWLVVKGEEKIAASILNRIYGKEEAQILVGNIKNLIDSETWTNWRSTERDHEQTPSTSLTVFGIGLPNSLCPFSVISTLSSIRIPPIDIYFSILS